MFRFIGNKGQMASLSGLGLQIVVFAVIVVAGALILAEFASNDAVTSDLTANETVADAQGGLSDLSGWIPLIVIMGVAVVILGYFGLKGIGGGGTGA